MRRWSISYVLFVWMPTNVVKNSWNRNLTFQEMIPVLGCCSVLCANKNIFDSFTSQPQSWQKGCNDKWIRFTDANTDRTFKTSSCNEGPWKPSTCNEPTGVQPAFIQSPALSCRSSYGPASRLMTLNILAQLFYITGSHLGQQMQWTRRAHSKRVLSAL